MYNVLLSIVRCKSAEQGRGRRDGLENGWNGFRNLGCLTFSGPGLPPATCSGPHCREKSEALAGPETNWFWSHQRPHQHPACPTIGSNFDIDIQPFSQFREGPYLTYVGIGKTWVISILPGNHISWKD